MSRRLAQLEDAHLSDETAERVRRSHQRAIEELQAAPLSDARVIQVELSATVDTEVAHGLGRAPVFVRTSVPRGSKAAIEEIRGRSHDRSKVVVLNASLDCTVDVLVF